MPKSWKVGELAPLSRRQQRELALNWFRHQQRAADDDEAAVGAAAWHAERFIGELQADGPLGELASNPLLFMGLLALAFRSLALPRNRAEALRSLIQILLEIHPQIRATAAGDMRPRFEHASTPEVRQAALAALAFASRRDGGDAGYPREQARKAIVDHLVQASGSDAAEARRVADEILAINAETVGLLVEKAPGEVGFAHASLEEFLGALHIQSWPLQELLDFVSEKAGESRWRNVLRNLVAVNPRANEIEEIVARLEAADLDVLGDVNRRQLLAEVAFGPSTMRSNTARRLSREVFAVIEGSGFEAERTALARIALQGLSDATLGADVAARVERWAPRCFSLGSTEFQNLRRWPKCDDLLQTLLAGLLDDENYVSRAAAQTLATQYGGDAEVEEYLRALIAAPASLNIAICALEALVRGWPAAELQPLLSACDVSRSPLLRSMGVWGAVLRGSRSDEDLGRCLDLLRPAGNLGFRDHDYVAEALLTGWPDDPRVVAEALRSTRQRHSDTAIDFQIADQYLRSCSPRHAELHDWVLEELQNDHPFVAMHSSSWAFLLPFCQANPEIHEAFVAYAVGDKGLYAEPHLWPLMAALKDDRLRDVAIERARAEGGHTRYWNLLPLLNGWRDDPEVTTLATEMIALADQDLDMTVALVPQLYDDAAEARERLLKVARSGGKMRRDLLMQAFGALDCTAADEEVVEAIMAIDLTSTRIVEDTDLVFLLFGEHPKVRHWALERLKAPRPPLAALILAYGEDEEIRGELRRRLTPARASVRFVVAEACAVNADRYPVLLKILSAFDAEVDFDLKVQMAIYYSAFRAARGPCDDLVERLVVESRRGGAGYEEAVAAAFAGLVQLGAPEKMDRQPTSRGRVRLGSLWGSPPNAALCSLVLEKWDELEASLADWPEGWLTGGDHGLWEALAPFLGAHGKPRRAFLDWCLTAKQLGTSTLKALAELSPRSDVLRTHVRRILLPDGHYGQSTALVIAAAEIARDHFADDHIKDELADRFSARLEGYAAIALSVLAPTSPALQHRTKTALQIAQEYNDWHAAAVLSAQLEAPEAVLGFIVAMAQRAAAPGYQHQSAVNAVLVSRLSRDEKLATLALTADKNAVGLDGYCALARYLSAAGKLDQSVERACATDLARELGRVDGPPPIVFDVMADQY
ncbi:MAG: NACHT domain-containing protein, partial [Ignavibacteriales bacterium]